MTIATILIDEIDRATPRKSAVANLCSTCGIQGVGQKESEREAARKGDRNAGERNGDCRTADFTDQPNIRVHACQEQQQQHAELSNAIKHSFLRCTLREDRSLHFGPDKAEKRWAEQDARDQMADDSGLAKTLHRLAEYARRQENDEDRAYEFRFRRHR